MKITKLDAPVCRGGEQSLWDAKEQALYYVDNFGQKVHRYDPADGSATSWDTPSIVTSLALRTAGGGVVTMHSGIYFLDFASGSFEPVHPLPDPPPHVYNDAKADSHGRWLIGASTAQFADPTPDGGLYRLDPDHSLTKLDTGIHFSNSPCFSPEERTFYFSDSWLKQCYAYDYDIETGEVANRRLFVDTSDLGGLPDGSTVDADGLVWIAIYGGAKSAAFTPDGKLEHLVEMPVRLVSSVSFGGPQLDRLYVTSIAEGVHGEPPEKGAGSVFVVEGLGARGLPERRFGG
jgi:L-arabinonolactonase